MAKKKSIPSWKILYDTLLAAVNNKEYKGMFYFRDEISPLGSKFRTFHYHFIDERRFTDETREARGICFEMEGEIPLRVASRPFIRFDNWNSNTMNEEEIDFMTLKVDGSIVSTYTDKGHLKLKSNSSILSDVAALSMSVLLDIRHHALADRLKELDLYGLTVVMEFTSPKNKVVVDYTEPKLTVLAVRNKETGEEVPYNEILKDPILRPYLVERFLVSVDTIDKIEGIEGYVIHSGNKRFKKKTSWYMKRHSAISMRPRAIYEAIAAGISDDIKEFVSEESRKDIESKERIYIDYLGKWIQECNTLFTSNSNRGLPRNLYWEKTSTLSQPFLPSVAMKLYEGTLSQEDMVKELSKLFVKYLDKLVKL
ncbi:RNA ligase [Shewanella phage Thanatos-1]|nr:RNA ligase [Shewanella phage Thanatos-1]